jgi:hypothetical protein
MVANADLQISKKSAFPKPDTVFRMKSYTTWLNVISNVYVLG